MHLEMDAIDIIIHNMCLSMQRIGNFIAEFKKINSGSVISRLFLSVHDDILNLRNNAASNDMYIF